MQTETGAITPMISWPIVSRMLPLSISGSLIGTGEGSDGSERAAMRVWVGRGFGEL